MGKAFSNGKSVFCSPRWFLWTIVPLCYPENSASYCKEIKRRKEEKKINEKSKGAGKKESKEEREKERGRKWERKKLTYNLQFWVSPFKTGNDPCTRLTTSPDILHGFEKFSLHNIENHVVASSFFRYYYNASEEKEMDGIDSTIIFPVLTEKAGGVLHLLRTILQFQ